MIEEKLDECEKCGKKIGLDWNAFKMCDECTKETLKKLQKITKKVIDYNLSQKDFKLPDLSDKFFTDV